MIGQIRSYISYITVDSEESYINRIRNMIANLDDANKGILTKELENKLNEIAIMKKFKKEEKKEEPTHTYYEPEQVYERVKSFEEEIDEMVNDYLNSQSDSSSGRSTSLPPIYTTAFNLLKIYSSKPILLRKLFTGNKKGKIMVKTSGINMPTLPIYDE